MLRYEVTAPGNFDSDGPGVVVYAEDGKTYQQRLPVTIYVTHARR